MKEKKVVFKKRIKEINIVYVQYVLSFAYIKF